MAILSHFDSPRAKPGAAFTAKNPYGFTGKLHSAIQQNYHGLGALKNNAATVNAINAQVLKNQHLIRRGGLSKFQAEKMIAKIHHEAAIKGEHLSATEKEALHKLGHHLTKQVIKRAPAANVDNQEHHGITSLSSTHHTTSVSRIGDQTKVTSSGEAVHASGGISSLIKQKSNPLTSNLPPKKPGAPIIKLSV
jgi:aspartate oxidase